MIKQPDELNTKEKELVLEIAKKIYSEKIILDNNKSEHISFAYECLEAAVLFVNHLEVYSLDSLLNEPAIGRSTSTAKLQEENEILKKFLDAIVSHDWDLSEMGAEEVYEGALKVAEKLEGSQ